MTQAGLHHKIVLIVGGASGIGGATARLCHADGAAVIIADRDAIRGEASAQALGAPFFTVDVTDEASVSALYTQIDARFGRIDALIHTAGILRGAYVPIEEFTLEMWRSVIDVNVTGTFLSSKYAVPLLKKAGRGVIVLTSSIAAIRYSSSYAYGASKGGVNGLGLTLEQKLAPDNIRVNVVMPGSIDTDMKRSVIAQEAQRDGETLETALTKYELGDPAGVGKILAWLVSDDADYMRGMLMTR